MVSPASSAVELLYEALHSEYGIEVSTTDPALLMQRLYKARKDEPACENLVIKLAPLKPKKAVLILKGVPDDAEAQD